MVDLTCQQSTSQCLKMLAETFLLLGDKQALTYTYHSVSLPPIYVACLSPSNQKLFCVSYNNIGF